eukprot:gene739-310_t
MRFGTVEQIPKQFLEQGAETVPSYIYDTMEQKYENFLEHFDVVDLAAKWVVSGKICPNAANVVDALLRSEIDTKCGSAM